MSISNSLASVLESFQLTADEGNVFRRYIPFDKEERANEEPWGRTSADPQTGISRASVSAIVYPPGIFHQSATSGFNCFFRFDRPWSHFVIHSNIIFSKVLNQYWIIDGSGPSTLEFHVSIRSIVNCWKRENETWIGLGGGENVLYEKTYSWSKTEGAKRNHDERPENVSMPVSHVIKDKLVEAGQQLMIRGSCRVQFDCNSHNFSCGANLNIDANTSEITFAGIV